MQQKFANLIEINPLHDITRECPSTATALIVAPQVPPVCLADIVLVTLSKNFSHH